MSAPRETGLVADPLFVGVTRPAMAWGVTYSAMLANFIVTAELFLLTKQLPWLLVCLPIHGVCWLVCKAEPRFFDLALLWGRTRGPGLFGNVRFWGGANSYSPLRLDLPDARCRRRMLWGEPIVRGRG
jgi:type IV secretion system protein VirB3